MTTENKGQVTVLNGIAVILVILTVISIGTMAVSTPGTFFGVVAFFVGLYWAASKLLR